MLAPRRSDLLVAAGLWAAAQVEIWVFWTPDDQGPRALALLATTLMAAALAFRTVRPLPAMAAIAAVYVAWALIDVPAGSLFPFVMILTAVFTVAERCGERDARIGGALGLIAIWAEIAVESSEVANYAFTGFFVAAAWFTGRGTGRRQSRADHLETRTLQLERDRETAVAEERARIARELHDVVAHSVGVMVIQAQAAQEVAAEDDAVSPALRSIEQTGRQALTEMRRLLGLLRSDDEEIALAPQPSMRHVGKLVERVEAAGLPVELVVEGDVDHLPPAVDLSAYRIVQEALTNALKHAGPARARVGVRSTATELSLEISDDGPGPADAAGADGGHGLVGMRERVSVYGGRLETGAGPEGGYAVRVRLPLEAARR